MQPLNCKKCSIVYTPKPGGWNSLYCSKKCKESVKARPAYSSEVRRKTYLRMKIDPDEYRKHTESGTRSRNKIRIWLATYKMERGCADCGYKEYAAALQFDHEGEKRFTISQIRTSIHRILREIENGKCVLRCANCHAVRTWHQKNKIPYIPKNQHRVVEPELTLED